MSYVLKMAPEIEQEENYYESNRGGLGEDFLSELNKCYNKVIENPFYYGYLEKSTLLRHIRVNRFPYIAIYIVSGSIITMLSVRNTHRRPYI